jgi:hypothetical protein
LPFWGFYIDATLLPLPPDQESPTSSLIIALRRPWVVSNRKMIRNGLNSYIFFSSQKKKSLSRAPVADACNPSYSGGSGESRRIVVQR